MAHPTLTKAIAKQLDQGNICYIDKRSHKIKTIAVLAEGATSTVERTAQLAALEQQDKKYYKVPQMSSLEEIHVMKDFIKEETNPAIQRELSSALKRKSPARNYMQIIENDEVVHQHWRNFKMDWYQAWVSGYLADIYRF